ncbi:hypothetical protein PSENEW3n2_00000872 [Picochlorum sp. SENEW3]|nr:hypothetical protein PSENEW3n2_00000872 [Picochlorum sp. SENEW3]WPT15794.1 hypothetical protein PSENEW3_00000872 [Picochlorum sp. SENEW3]
MNWEFNAVSFAQKFPKFSLNFDQRSSEPTCHIRRQEKLIFAQKYGMREARITGKVADALL